MRRELETCEYELSIPETGTFFIVANHKALHARSKMNIDIKLAEKFSEQKDFYHTPRLLFRSKGPRKEYHEIFY
jgi:hypothetical protein